MMDKEAGLILLSSLDIDHNIVPSRAAFVADFRYATVAATPKPFLCRRSPSCG